MPKKNNKDTIKINANVPRKLTYINGFMKSTYPDMKTMDDVVSAMYAYFDLYPDELPHAVAALGNFEKAKK